MLVSAPVSAPETRPVSTVTAPWDCSWAKVGEHKKASVAIGANSFRIMISLRCVRYVVAQRWRSTPPGSFSTRHSSLNTMVVRVWAVYTGHCGSLEVFGLPLRAKAIQASLILSASAAGLGPPPDG